MPRAQNLVPIVGHPFLSRDHIWRVTKPLAQEAASVTMYVLGTLLWATKAIFLAMPLGVFKYVNNSEQRNISLMPQQPRNSKQGERTRTGKSGKWRVNLWELHCQWMRRWEVVSTHIDKWECAEQVLGYHNSVWPTWIWENCYPESKLPRSRFQSCKEQMLQLEVHSQSVIQGYLLSHLKCNENAPHIPNQVITHAQQNLFIMNAWVSQWLPWISVNRCISQSHTNLQEMIKTKMIWPPLHTIVIVSAAVLWIHWRCCLGIATQMEQS